MTDAFRVGTPVTQAAHGFVRGRCVIFDGSDWVSASTGGLGVGLVGDIVDVNAFQFVVAGELDGLDGLTPGAIYYTDSSGNLTTSPNGPPVGKAYTDRVLFVGTISDAASSIDTSMFATKTELAAAITGEVLRADAAYAPIGHNHDNRYLHSVQHNGVISVDIAAPGPIFDASDGTQVLTA